MKHIVTGILAGCLISCCALAAGDDASFFHRQIEPLFKEHCYGCHSHQARTIEGGLTLDWRSGWATGGSRGPAIVPGDVEASLLVQAIRHRDPELKMPESRLQDDQIALIEEWVRRGAPDDRSSSPAPAKNEAQSWWSLSPLERPAIPAGDFGHPIDAFVGHRLQQDGLTLSPQTDRRTLIRRVTYDLTGLPPTPAEVTEFLADTRDRAYEHLVDRLLASPAYGERWARHWLDTIHFADSHGFEHDIGRDHAWPYRDYVIESLNRDLPWRDFIRQQLAADVLYADQPQLTTALGFLGAGTFDLSAFSTAPVTFDYLDRDDLVAQTMAAFNSTTAACARCHDHKFDPITQADYYSLQAVFAGILKGDITYESDRQIAAQRRHWEAIQTAASHRDARVVLADEHAATVQAWVERESHRIGSWQTLELSFWKSTDGSELNKLAGDVIAASGPRPERDTYAIVGTTPLKQITALRLDVLAHESLPMKGPGRQDNGNLHLSEVVLSLAKTGPDGQKRKFRRAVADFNQDGWTIDRAIDDRDDTAWGIFPAVGQSHTAVFELETPVELPPGTGIIVALRQLHGGGHLIGRLRLSVTDRPLDQYVPLPMEVDTALATDAAQRTEAQRVAIASYALQQQSAAELSRLPTPGIIYAAASAVQIPSGEGKFEARSIAEPKVVHVLYRGDIQQPREVATPGSLSALSWLPARFELPADSPEGNRRAALADWLAADSNVLTWRSAVNRAWHYHFGAGLCSTPSDFGRMGAEPSDPQLLDWLACWFRDDAQGSLKQLHRLIVTSAAYRQTSQHRDEAAQIDGDNRLLWKQRRQRLDADTYRDSILAVSGGLDRSMGGPGVQYFRQSKGPQSTPALDYANFDWTRPGVGRRSIYRYVWRGIADPFMESLDFPDLGLLSPVRGQSTSALQALTMYNNQLVLYHSQLLAQQLQSRSSDVNQQVSELGWRIWQRELTADELSSMSRFVREQNLAALCRVMFNTNEFLFVD